ncbi:permease for cytosine/purine, uracil, thiamine, allantoin domain-containing protein [Ditylenchus destructor]|nr:permease for cytosine/purine, uracil, thiamine, allantoin domain-containing protein [Ditylenchus destructor]
MPGYQIQPLGIDLKNGIHSSISSSKSDESDEANYDPKLYNEDLKPLKNQTWTSYNIFAVWMSDVHSIAGYLTAGSLFSLRLASWQVLIALLIGIMIVHFCCNLSAKPCQVTAVPYPVINRAIFGIRGANIPAFLRGSIAIAWYGVQTYLASKALVLVLLKFWPALATVNDVENYGFVGLSLLGWVAFIILWSAQAAVFWKGMEAVKRFVDWAGPAVYVAMLAQAVYLVWKAGWSNLGFNLSAGKPLEFWESIPVMMSAIALVVSYFSGPMLNFGDFSRYAKSWDAVKCGNIWGLPVNFFFFSMLTVVSTSATKPLFGELITDPIEVMDRIDHPIATILGGLTFVVATVGINIVANFISPAFDFSNLAPQYISWRSGGMITAIGSILLTPWNWYNNPAAIHYALGVLGALIGPLHGILIAGYYISSKQKVWVADMYSTRTDGRYWFSHGVNPNAVYATVISGTLSIGAVLLPRFLSLGSWMTDYSWFIGGIVGFSAFALLEHFNPKIRLDGVEMLDNADSDKESEATKTEDLEGERWHSRYFRTILSYLSPHAAV